MKSSGEQPKRFRPLKVIVKLTLTALALYLVLRKIDLDETWKWISQLSALSIIAALLLYNLSQIISSYRLNLFFAMEQIVVSARENIKLYYIGMFYNLFLLGGIGGDGYKIYLLKNELSAPIKNSFRALLADRLSGAVALAFLCLIFFLTLPLLQDYFYLAVVAIAGIILIIPVSAFIVNRFFKSLRLHWLKSVLYSIFVQGIQLLAAIVLFINLNISMAELNQYAAVFFISSLFAAIPVTIGGVGARELVFVLAASYTDVTAEKAIAFSLIFFAINAFSSLPGVLLNVNLKPNTP
ncbi:MAG: flippase-like domain-containing protein [Cyclobacteriaceae bacterium]|nr:flippase-like domain-containing protein [Cyclobacteriaceae bacterium]